MKVGILTFHSQLNYGGVLQAYALQLALEDMGYDPVIVDLWLTRSNWHLCGPFTWSKQVWKDTLIKLIVRRGATIGLLRCLRTMRFVRKKMRLSPYHFCSWNEAPKELGVDCLVVGSDQVWHSGDWGNPRPYLLEGMEAQLPAIAYAASFGMRELPEALIETYREGFKRFRAISVREAEGCGLVASMGGTATHVLDPTLLLKPEIWKRKVRTYSHKRPVLVCYFISEDLDAIRPSLEAFSRQYHCDVHVLLNLGKCVPFNGLRSIIRSKMLAIREFMSPIKVYYAAGPQEFLTEFASADYVLSDSFHAVMFSAIFEKNVRILRPHNKVRMNMFARIEEIAEHAVSSGTLISDDVPSALRSFMEDDPVKFDAKTIAERRNASREWLEAALRK